MLGHKTEIDPLLELIKEIDSLKSRIYVLEMTDRNIEEDIKKRDDTLASDRESALQQLILVKREIKDMWKELRKIVIHVHKLIIEIKNKAKTDDLKRINSMADAWSPEKYITKREFERLVSRYV